MKNNVEFGAIVEMVRAGGTVEDERLLDAWAYASDGFNEIYRLCKSLMDGFREQARAMRKMNAIIEEKNRQIDEKNRIIWVLNRKLQAETERTEGRETTSSGAYAPPSPQGEGFTRDEGRGRAVEDAGPYGDEGRGTGETLPPRGGPPPL